MRCNFFSSVCIVFLSISESVEYGDRALPIGTPTREDANLYPAVRPPVLSTDLAFSMNLCCSSAFLKSSLSIESTISVIKTGTGFEDDKYAASMGNRTGAQVENVKLMAEFSRKYNPEIGIKAAGGIHTYSDAMALLEASGRTADPLRFRIGASSTAKIKETAPR